MSVLSALGKIIGGIILGLFLIGLIFVSAMAQFTAYDNLQPTFVNLISTSMPINESQFPQTKAMFTQYCQQPGITAIDIGALGNGAANMTLKCSDIASATSAQQLAQSMATSMFDSIYYKNYTCEFISCMSTLPEQERMTIMSSAHANAFFNQAIMWCIGGIILGLVLLIVAIRKPFGIAKAVGIEMIASGAVAYVGTNAIKGMMSAGMPSEVISIANTLFGILQSNFVIVLAIGAVLAVVGFVGTRFTKAKVKKKK
jgi:hypothetical protein